MVDHKHTCLFYRTKDELIEIAVPFLQSGLANHEFCLWTLPSLLSTDEAASALSQAVGSLEPYLDKGQLEISTAIDYYLKSRTFTAYEMIEHWREKEKEVAARGFAGISAIGDGGWGAEEYWINLLFYEHDIESIIDNSKMKAICTYQLNQFDITKINAIGRTHHAALAKSQDQWNIYSPKDFKDFAM
ncbi:MAG TPA: MEDS domain-containing protein [Candidatus Omnitrophota bacterium]|nr:MEDS domain-containing protein [Candidatus Omnitrophota bacterium]HPD84913.1 MEDS domain-containing protein [Candidatus Omnitrophota bacterium]HRZ03771.1 MEDS domain-containing protein [Candidatus Omnitrophota bacterium]